MARASTSRTKTARTLASATRDSAPPMDIEQAMREAADDTAAPRSAPSRTGKRGVVGYVSPELWAQLRHLAIDETSSIQALVLEGLDRVLKARGITPMTKD